MGSIPGQGTKIPHAVEQLGTRATTIELELCNSRVCVSDSQDPAWGKINPVSLDKDSAPPNKYIKELPLGKTVIYMNCLVWPLAPVAQQKRNCLQCTKRRRYRFDPWVRTIPWRRKWQPTPLFLPEKSHGWRSLVGHHPWGYKELDTTEQLRTHTPSSIPFRHCTCCYETPSICQVLHWNSQPTRNTDKTRHTGSTEWEKLRELWK